MSVFIGKPEYSPVKGFAPIKGDMSNVNATVFVNEGKILDLGETGIAFCMYVSKIAGANSSDPLGNDAPVVWLANAKEYTIWTKENPKKPTQPTQLELLTLEWFKGTGSVWKDKCFKGKLSLNGASSVLDAISQNGLWHILFDFQETEPSLIKELVANSSGRGKGGGYQGELAKLTDRQAFAIKACGAYGEGCETLQDLSLTLTSLRQDNPEAYATLLQLLELSLKAVN